MKTACDLKTSVFLPLTINSQFSIIIFVNRKISHKREYGYLLLSEKSRLVQDF